MTATTLPVRVHSGPGRTGRRHSRRSVLKSGGSRFHPSCQNWRMTESPGGSVPEVLSLKLTACRQRGIERLDVHTHNQSPVPRPVLQQLADEYLAVTAGPATSRIAQLKYLLRDAIRAFERENEAAALTSSAGSGAWPGQG